MPIKRVHGPDIVLIVNGEAHSWRLHLQIGHTFTEFVRRINPIAYFTLWEQGREIPPGHPTSL